MFHGDLLWAAFSYQPYARAPTATVIFKFKIKYLPHARIRTHNLCGTKLVRVVFLFVHFTLDAIHMYSGSYLPLTANQDKVEYNIDPRLNM